MAWLSRPGTLLGSIQVPPSLLIQQAQQAQKGAVGFRTPSALHLDPLGSSGSGLDASAEERPATPAAEAANHLEWWQETQLEAAAAPASPPDTQPPPAPELELAAAARRQQQQQQGPDGSALDGSFTLPLLSPFESTARPFPAAQSQPGAGGEPAAAAGGGAAMAPPAEADGSAQVSTEPSLTPLVTGSQAASEARRTSAREPAAVAPPQEQEEEQQEEDEEQPAGAAGPAEGSLAPDETAASPAGLGAAGAAAATPSQQSPRGGLPSLRHMRAATSQLARRSAQQRQRSVMAPMPSDGLPPAHGGASAAAPAAGDSFGGRQPGEACQPSLCGRECPPTLAGLL